MILQLYPLTRSITSIHGHHGHHTHLSKHAVTHSINFDHNKEQKKPLWFIKRTDVTTPKNIWMIYLRFKRMHGWTVCHNSSSIRYFWSTNRPRTKVTLIHGAHQRPLWQISELLLSFKAAGTRSRSTRACFHLHNQNWDIMVLCCCYSQSVCCYCRHQEKWNLGPDKTDWLFLLCSK